MRTKRKPIKVKWEWASTPDAEERLQAAFDIIFGQIAAPPTDKLSTSANSDPETQEAPGQLPLF